MILCKIKDSFVEKLLLNKSEISKIKIEIITQNGSSIITEAYDYELIGKEDDINNEDIFEQEEDTEEPVSYKPVANIFSGDYNGEKSPVTERLAATQAPSSRDERKYAIKTREEIYQNNDFVEKHPQIKEPKFVEFIENQQQFFEALNKSKHKIADIDVEPIRENDPIPVKRQKALALEQKEKLESIGMPAFIVNEKAGNLMINDIDLSVPLNVPVDLSRFSAKKLDMSNDLKALINQGILRFVSPEEAVAITKRKMSDENKITAGCDVFSSHEEAERSMRGEAIIDNSPEDGDYEEMDLTDDLDGETEQERLASQTVNSPITNLTQKSPKSGGVRRTVHGNIRKQTRPKSSSSQHSQSSDQPTVRKKF